MSDSPSVLEILDQVIESRRNSDPDSSYVATLLAGADARVLKKIGEEATELVIACKEGDRQPIVSEAADLLFHMLVALARHDLTSTDVLGELERRFGTSGHAEKAARKA